MSNPDSRIPRTTARLLLCVIVMGIHGPTIGMAEGLGAKSEKAVTAVVTDAEGVETEIRNVLFYYEDKVSETAFVPHELRHVPVKKGTATVNVKFENIKQIDVKPAADGSLPLLTITLANGKKGEFALATAGSFKGGSDFGDVDIPVHGITTVSFR